MTWLRRFLEFSLSLGGIAVWISVGLLLLFFVGPTTQIAYDIELAGTPATSVTSNVCGVEKPGNIVNGRAQGVRQARCDDRMTSTVRYADHVVVCDLGYLSAVPFGGRVEASYRILDRRCEYIPDEAALRRFEAAG